MLVSRALDDTEKMRKASADIFGKSGPENPITKSDKIKMLSGFPMFSCGFSQKPVNSRTSGWEPNRPLSPAAIRMDTVRHFLLHPTNNGILRHGTEVAIILFRYTPC